jgi:hypothetical protein
MCGCVVRSVGVGGGVVRTAARLVVCMVRRVWRGMAWHGRLRWWSINQYDRPIGQLAYLV